MTDIKSVINLGDGAHVQLSPQIVRVSIKGDEMANVLSVTTPAMTSAMTRSLFVGCAVSCYGKAPSMGITRAVFRADARFEDLFEEAREVVTLSVEDCCGKGVSETQALDALDPRRAVRVIADQIGGVEKLATAKIDILLDHEFSQAWLSAQHTPVYAWFIAALRAACPEACIDQYGSVARDVVRHKDPARHWELTQMDELSSSSRLGVGGGCFPHLYVPYRVGTPQERMQQGGIPWSPADLREFVNSNMGRYDYVADRRAVPRITGLGANQGGRCVVISPWVGDQWTKTEDGCTDFTANPRAGKQALYEILLSVQQMGWRAKVWSACVNARQAKLVAQALEEDVLPAVQAVRSGKRPEWAWGV